MNREKFLTLVESAAVIALLSAGAGCAADGSPSAAAPVYLYAGSDGQVSGFSLNAVTGALTALAGFPVTGSISHLGWAADPGGAYLYFSACSGLSSFAVNATTGALTPVAGSPFTASITSCGSLAVSPPGSILCTARTTVSGIDCYSMAAGVPTPLTLPAYTSGAYTGGGAFDSAGTHYYSGNTNLLGFAVAGTTLSQLSGSPFSAVCPPLQLTMDPLGKALYGMCSNAVEVFPLTAGVPGAAAKYQITSGQLQGMAVTPDGKYVYVANFNGGSISAYSVGGGLLTGVLGSPFAAGTAVAAVAVDPSGQFLFAANGGQGTITGYSINDSTGVLTALSGSPTPAGVATASILAFVTAAGH